MSTFSTATNFPVGTNPNSVVVGDFNKDGKPDIATSNNGSANISILLGTGTGSFGTATNLNIGLSPISLALGDFNSDGNLDIASMWISEGKGRVAILLGNGTGSFGTPTNFDTGADDGESDRGYAIGVGDLNNDGKLDLATIHDSGNISTLLGTGTGSFGTPIKVNGGDPFPRSVVLEDFNADGKLDLAVTDYYSDTDNVWLLLGTGTGNFGAPTKFDAGSYPYGLATGDFNGDNKPDIAVANLGSKSNNVSILLGTGTGGFGAAANFNAGTRSGTVAVGDFNSDNKSDLAVANDDGVSILLGNGTGSFGVATNFGAGENPYLVAVGDFNTDGKTDLVTTNYDSNSVSVLLNNNDAADNSGNNDNDTAGVAVSLTEIKAIEGGANGTYDLKLKSQPTAPVTINLTTGNQIQSIAPLTFTPNNWNVAQTVTVKAVDDTVAESTGSANITHTATSTDAKYNGIAVSPVRVAIEDNDTAPTPTETPTPIPTNPGITIDPESGLVTTETGGTGKFTIKLNSQPTADVQIDLRSSNDAEGVISPKTVTFNSTNWNVPQTVTVTGVDDSVSDGNKNYTIFTYAAISADSNYSGLNAADVAVINTDNEPKPNNESAVDAATGQQYITGELLVKLKKDANEATIQSELFTANGAIEVENLVPPSPRSNPPSNATNSTSQGIAFFSENEAIAFENVNSISNGQPDSTPDQLPQWRVVKFASDTDLQQVKAKLANDPNVEAVEFNYEISLQDIPNDPEFEKLWALNNTGQTGGTADADIDATKAWTV